MAPQSLVEVRESVRPYLPFLIPFLLALLLAGPVAFIASRDGRPLFGPPTYVGVVLDDLEPSEQPFIEVSGMSHYPVVVRQDLPGNLFRADRTLYMFPLMKPHDVDGRVVRILVRTTRQPASLVSYEFMTVRGKVEFATQMQVPFGTEELLGRKGYYFADELLVIEADEVFEAPVPTTP